MCFYSVSYIYISYICRLITKSNYFDTYMFIYMCTYISRYEFSQRKTRSPSVWFLPFFPSKKNEVLRLGLQHWRVPWRVCGPMVRWDWKKNFLKMWLGWPLVYFGRFRDFFWGNFADLHFKCKKKLAPWLLALFEVFKLCARESKEIWPY